VGPRPGVNDMEKLKLLTLPGIELRLLCRPAQGQSLYKLHGGAKVILNSNLTSNFMMRSFVKFRLYSKSNMVST
jgi:hypothetical protein